MVNAQMHPCASFRAEMVDRPRHLDQWLDVGHPDQPETDPLAGVGVDGMVSVVQPVRLLPKVPCNALTYGLRLVSGRR